MTAALCLSLLALLWQAPQALTGVLQGVITRTGTTDPVPDVQVSLIQGTVVMPPDAPPGNFFGSSPARTATSDRDGKFNFKDLPPGRYTVRLQSQGFFPATTNPSSVAVTAGGTHEIRLSAIPGAIVRGRVRDTAGQFASNVNVQAFAIQYQGGFPVLRPTVSKMTDDRGEYRLFGVGPGEYYIGVLPRPPTANPTPGTGTVRSVRTFFPAAIDASGAVAITVKGGEEITNMDIAMQSARYVRVSGRVTSEVAPPSIPAGATPPGVFTAIAQAQNNMANLMLVPRDITVADEPGPKAAVSVLLNASSAEFEIQNVMTGRYDLIGVANGQQGAALSRIPVDVVDQDVTGLTLIARPGIPVKGTITMPAGVPSATARISLLPVDGLFRANVFGFQTSAPAGPFSLSNVPDAHYRVMADLPPNLYVEDILQNGRSVYDSGFSVRGASPEPLEIVVQAGAASIEGVVHNPAGSPIPGAIVALVPSTRRENQNLYKTVTSDEAGRFAFRGATPGEYKLFSWITAPPGASSNPAFLARYEQQGQPITLLPNTATAVRVPLSPEAQR